ncbi:MAG TPA: TadE/TadG family type IV pilus assembly protein [Ktedonobacterales bacterium]|nr:TadE/TadG family type IV pilus assembly protein [Ktedonobacterales bacterium]
MTISSSRSWRRLFLHHERGQALIEFSMFFLFLVTLTAGIVDIGGLLNDHISVEYAARQGARTASVLGNQGSADCAVIGAVNAAVSNMPNLKLTGIKIYQSGNNGKSTGKEDDYPAGAYCQVTNSVPCIIISGGPCNGNNGNCQAPPATVCGYLPAARNNSPFTEDSVGVEVDYTYTFRFDFALLVSGSFSANDYAVMPINPVAIPSPVPTPTQLPTPMPTIV